MSYFLFIRIFVLFLIISQEYVIKISVELWKILCTNTHKIILQYIYMTYLKIMFFITLIKFYVWTYTYIHVHT